MVEKQNVELKLIHMEDVVSKEVEWLWYPYIPYGKITIIEGDPGEGKTTLVLKLAAALSRGLPLPCDDDKEYEPIHIIYQTAEDGIEDTIKPRLEKEGADCSMIRVIDETDKELLMTDDRLLFVVSSLLKDVINKVLDGNVNIKQVIVLTHNVYFHKELSFMGNGNNPNKNIHYWILRKKDGVTNIQYYGTENPISSSYELLWKELKEQNANSVITIQNVMRRIIENYFKILGKYKDDELINKFPDYESQEICRSLLSWINDGSHCMPDDLYVEALDDSSERYQEVFKKIFEYTNHIEHYNMMMGINENTE